MFALGDQFLEVVVPVEDETAAGRFIDRTGGQGGYMAIFQTAKIEFFLKENSLYKVELVDLRRYVGFRSQVLHRAMTLHPVPYLPLVKEGNSQ